MGALLDGRFTREGSPASVQNNRQPEGFDEVKMPFCYPFEHGLKVFGWCGGVAVRYFRPMAFFKQRKFVSLAMSAAQPMGETPGGLGGLEMRSPARARPGKDARE